MLEKKVNQKRDCCAPKALAMTNGKAGSALIMTVVLTVLLSIVAVMFVMVARMDSASTSNIVDSKTLDNAAKSIIEIIGKELVLDTPGVASQEYQDYPDVNDAWLASIEPYEDSGTYYWRQISDVTGYLRNKYDDSAVENIDVKPEGILYNPDVVRDYPEFGIDENGRIGKVISNGSIVSADNGISADADGDGIADSKWIELDGLNTSKGKKVFAAIRIIDNCAMVNVNTAYKFDGTSNDRFRVDGTSQLQINLEGLLKTGGNDNIDAFHKARCGGDSALYVDDSTGWNKYDRNVIWDYNVPGGNYLPFDISDELELRYRYCIDSRFISRFETDANITATIRGRGDPDFGNLYDGSSDWGLPAWNPQITDPNDGYADRRHLLTTYSFDRIIDPDGEKMRSVYSSESAQELYERLADCIDANNLTAGEIDDLHAYFAQFAANMVDRSDIDANVSIVTDNKYNVPFYGDEKPYIYISEIARNFKEIEITEPNGALKTVIARSYAIELFKEYEQDANDAFDDWELIISGNPLKTIYIDSNDFQSRGGQYYVYIYEDSNAPLQDDVKYTDTPKDGAKNVDPDAKFNFGPLFLKYDSDANAILSNRYEFYISTDKPSVDAANTDNHPAGLDIGGFPVGGLTSGYYDPVLNVPKITYYWKFVGWNDANTNETKSSSVRSFTTWDVKPVDFDNVEPNAFSDNPFIISLWRPTTGVHAPILADEVNLPGWLTDFNVGGGGKRTFQRDIRPGFCVKRIWDRIQDPLSFSITLGRMNGNDPFQKNPIQLWHHNFTNVGDAAMLFAKKSIYLQCSSEYRIGSADKESEVRFDINSPSMQNVFKYITALNPDNYPPYDSNETRVRGRININTAPAFVMAQLPWVSKVNRQDLKIADAIVAYRDKLNLSLEGGPDYYNSGAADARELETDIDDIYEAPGFRSVGELLAVINKSGKEYSIRYCGMDNGQQYGFPDLTFNSESMDDEIEDDLEEKELIFARISDLATVRSDTFTAYILVRVGVDGPQKRFIAILDRTGVKTKDDKVNVAAFQQVPAAR